MNILKFQGMFSVGHSPSLAMQILHECHKGQSVPDETTQTVNNVPYLNDEVAAAAQAAGDLYQNNTASGSDNGYYPNSTVVPFSDQTQAALSGIENRATQGSSLTQGAQNLAQSSINGDYLNANPYIDQVIGSSNQDITDNYLNNVMPQLNSTFAQSGRFGSGAQALAGAQSAQDYLDTVGQNSSQIRYQNYSDERGRQAQYAAMAPTLAQQDYIDLDRLAGVGQAHEGLAANYLQDDIDRHYYNQNYGENQLDNYINRINTLNGNFGTANSTGTNPQAQSSGGVQGAIAGGSAGLGLAGAAGFAAGGPVGIGLGLGGALLGGLF